MPSEEVKQVLARLEFTGVAGHQRVRLEEAMTYIRKHCTRGLILDDVATVAGLSAFHFHRLFRRHFGKTVKQAQIQCQVEFVKELLRADAPLVAAAKLAGFVNQSHMTLRFKKLTGVTPARWVKMQSHSHADRPSARKLRTGR